MRKKVVCIAQSVGPLNSRSGKFLTKWVFQRVVAVTVRDNQSKVLLESLGIRDVMVLADAAYAIGYQNEAALNRQKQLVLSLRPWVEEQDAKISGILAEFILWVRENYDLETVFLPFQTKKVEDRECYERIKKKLGGRAHGFQLIKPEDFSQAMEIISRSELVIGMRLHSIIFAVLGRTPFLGLSYSKKVRDFVETIGLEEFSLNYSEINLADLQEKFKALQKNREKVIQKMEKAKLHYTYEFFRHEEVLKKAMLG